jgi:hypothetical protein
LLVQTELENSKASADQPNKENVKEPESKLDDLEGPPFITGKGDHYWGKFGKHPQSRHKEGALMPKSTATPPVVDLGARLKHMDALKEALKDTWDETLFRGPPSSSHGIGDKKREKTPAAGSETEGRELEDQKSVLQRAEEAASLSALEKILLKAAQFDLGIL